MTLGRIGIDENKKNGTTIYLHQDITFMRKIQSRNDRSMEVADIVGAALQSESWQKQVV